MECPFFSFYFFTTTSELPRYNIPNELGLDIGALEYGSRKLRTGIRSLINLKNESNTH